MEGSKDAGDTYLQQVDLGKESQTSNTLQDGKEAPHIVLGQAAEKDEDPDEEGMSYAAEWMTPVLDKHQEVFESLSGSPPQDRIQHSIQLIEGAKPVMKRPYRLSEVQKESAKEQIEQALDEGWIQPSTSPWGTSILMVPKKDGTWRMCVDYRDLNALTVTDAYPLPRIDDLLHKLGSAKFFSKLDLQAG